MANSNDTHDLAMRLRRDAAETCLPLYAALMRRAADELEAALQHGDSVMNPCERKAG